MALPIVQVELAKRPKLPSPVEFMKSLFMLEQLRTLQTRLRRTIEMKSLDIPRRDPTMTVTNALESEPRSFHSVIYFGRSLNHQRELQHFRDA